MARKQIEEQAGTPPTSKIRESLARNVLDWEGRSKTERRGKEISRKLRSLDVPFSWGWQGIEIANAHYEYLAPRRAECFCACACAGHAHCVSKAQALCRDLPAPRETVAKRSPDKSILTAALWALRIAFQLEPIFMRLVLKYRGARNGDGQSFASFFNEPTRKPL